MTAATVVLWRHGRTEWNAAHRLQGGTDIALDDVGRWQVTRAAQALAERHVPDLIVSSDLGRAADTAQALADLAGLDVVRDARLRERSFGEWEGLTADEIAERWPDQYRAWRGGQDPHRAGAESREAVAERMALAIEEHAGRTPTGGTLVVVSHGAAITLGLVTLLGLDPATWRGLFGLHNAHWSVLRRSAGQGRPRWAVESHNRGPSVLVEDWDAGRPTESVPSSTADALRT
ncbi:histidine phosphatase family protein [Cellulomonas carbonis]|uniref:Phosphoglycerate mutase n=1 Tax=Cellulomonas carbonis T26 TaxID=947969 RepID=A0A0A0BUU3_9CELL|nr:histidine phosphatase family protein [Cellulomonas carbonis]KGM10929.1 phosphoglycerate mutase [Cellulomonas carbonis T26]GGC12875.1 phosphoglycerate mutase [Cellulomonas carbonis]